MFKCYTLNQRQPVEGIDPASFDCLVSSTNDQPIFQAELQMVPVLEGLDIKDIRTAQLCLAFVLDSKEQTETKPGAIVRVNTDWWHICADSSQMVLLDPGNDFGDVLLFLPPDTENALIENDPAHKNWHRVVSTDSDGNLQITEQGRGALLLSSLGIKTAQAAPVPESCPGDSRTTAAGGMKPHKAIAQGSRRKPRTDHKDA